MQFVERIDTQTKTLYNNMYMFNIHTHTHKYEVVHLLLCALLSKTEFWVYLSFHTGKAAHFVFRNLFSILDNIWPLFLSISLFLPNSLSLLSHSLALALFILSFSLAYACVFAYKLEYIMRFVYLCKHSVNKC